MSSMKYEMPYRAINAMHYLFIRLATAGTGNDREEYSCAILQELVYFFNSLLTNDASIKKEPYDDDLLKMVSDELCEHDHSIHLNNLDNFYKGVRFAALKFLEVDDLQAERIVDFYKLVVDKYLIEELVLRSLSGE